MRQTPTHTFFFTQKDGFSNWHIAPFEYRGYKFNCVEQFMMYSKACLFKDMDTAQKILSTTNQKEQKALGRQVKNFDEALWNEKCEHIVAVACREKFRQNPSLLTLLLSTGDTTLVEASPYDRIWGVGLGMDDPAIDDERNWRGQNKLGRVLMGVRAQLRAFQPEEGPQEVKRAGFRP